VTAPIRTHKVLILILILILIVFLILVLLSAFVSCSCRTPARRTQAGLRLRLGLRLRIRLGARLRVRLGPFLQGPSIPKGTFCALDQNRNTANPSMSGATDQFREELRNVAKALGLSLQEGK
jgi:hypothetical protein